MAFEPGIDLVRRGRFQDGLLVNAQERQEKREDQGTQDEADHAEVGDASQDGKEDEDAGGVAAPFHDNGLQNIVDDAHHHPAPDDQADTRPEVTGEEEVDGRRPPNEGAAHDGDHRGRNHHRTPEGRLGHPEDQKTDPAQKPLDKGDDHRAPEGGLDGRLGLPENLLIVGGLQGGELQQFGDEGVALEKHEEGDEQHQQQVKEEVSEAFDQAHGIGVNKGAGFTHRRLDDLLQIDLSGRQRQVQADQVKLGGVDLGGNPGPDLAALHALGHVAGKIQGLGGDDAHQAEERDQDDQQQNDAGEGRGQGPSAAPAGRGRDKAAAP